MHPQRLAQIEATAKREGWSRQDYLALVIALQKQSAEIKRLRLAKEQPC